MITVVAYTYDPAGDGHIRAVLSGMGGLIVARRDDPWLLTEVGAKTRQLFEMVMPPPPPDESEAKEDGAVKKSSGLIGGVTDIYTELADSGEQQCCTIVVCWTNDGTVEAGAVGRAFGVLLVRILGAIRASPPPFWLNTGVS